MSPDPSFHTTHWSQVHAAVGEDRVVARAALSELCEAYWYPLYAFVRRRGRSADEASDLVQGFFARLIEKGELARADEARGRLRGFLLANLRFYEANLRRRERAEVRGGGRVQLSIDAGDADGRYVAEPGHAQTAERLYEEAWTRTLLEHARERLRAEYAARGKDELFLVLQDRLLDDAGSDRQELCERLELSEGALAVALHRLRRRFAEALRAEVAATVSSAREVDEELRTLLGTVSGG